MATWKKAYMVLAYMLLVMVPVLASSAVPATTPLARDISSVREAVSVAEISDNTLSNYSFTNPASKSKHETEAIDGSYYDSAKIFTLRPRVRLRDIYSCDAILILEVDRHAAMSASGFIYACNQFLPETAGALQIRATRRLE